MTMRMTEHHARILKQYSFSDPPGKEVLSMRYNTERNAWYVETDLGWYYWDGKHWALLPQGPIDG
jgi:hypothetical protein